MSAPITYPIGEQDFRNLREDGCIYIDKTRFIEKLLLLKNRYYFLARPRRFGKSLFLSTLKYFFEGDRDLFKGLYIDSFVWEWEKFPVLHLDLNSERYEDAVVLEDVLDTLFSQWEKEYDVIVTTGNYAQRFKNIIKGAYDKTGRQVVILVDEYDKPLVSSLNDNDKFERYRSRLSALYSNFKSSAPYLRLVLLTGVSRFSRLSIFSDLNNLNDITFENDFADICGVTEKEMLANLYPGIEALAAKQNRSIENALEELKTSYDGYRFAETGSDIYNPWSLLNCLQKQRLGQFWNLTGKPTVIAELLKRTDTDLEECFNSRCPLDALAGLDLEHPNMAALMYQTGYLTIKRYDASNDIVTLGIPNQEVTKGLFTYLLPYYVQVKRGSADATVYDIIESIKDGKPELMVEKLDVFLSGIPYEMKLEDENNLQNAIYILLTLIGQSARVEVHTSDGRIDLLIENDKFVYVIELKYDRSANEAIAQIENKEYHRKYHFDPRKIFLIGINFSSERRRLDPPSIKVIIPDSEV